VSAGPAVAVRGLSHRFGSGRDQKGGTVALDGVSFEVAPAELFGVIGPDGAGKTTLFRVLATLLVPRAGEARVLGLDVVRDLWALRARIGYMPGRFALYPDLSVAENLRFFAAVFGTTVEAGRALIEPIYRQIAPFADRHAGALSGGMKQKLALCCALVHRPDLLLLDEPTTGVDAVSRREFWDLLVALKESGLTVVVSTPYMDEAARCDRVALVQAGRVLDVGAPLSFGARFARPVLAVRPAPGAEALRGPDRMRVLAALRALPHAASAFPFGEALHYTDRRDGADAPAVAGEVARALADALGGAGPRLDVAPITPGIEDVFMARIIAASAAPGAA
jgi:ABC-type multidrug transport system ATPase subunit